MGYDIDTSKPVLVTGATGYVAGWILKKLVEAGVTVHCAVRDPSNEKKVAHLHALAADAPGEVKLFKADLLIPGSYAEGMANCGIVFHTASPFKLQVNDPQKDLIDPAVEGTRNVFEEAGRTPSVTRVVLTSSCAAIYGTQECVKAAPGGILTEDLWNTRSTLENGAYTLSKTLAEKLAWELAKAQDRYNLVVINPALIVGRALSRATSASFDIMRALVSGAFAGTALPGDSSIGMVDVRDVAEAHVAAAYTTDASGRFINFAVSHAMSELGDFLRKAEVVPAEKLPLSKKFEGDDVWRADNSKSQRVLGLQYRPIDEGVVEMAKQVLAEMVA